MTRLVYLIIAILAFAPAKSALACSDPLHSEFRELVATSPNIFTFQVTSAFYIRKPLGGATFTEYVVGNIRVVDTLKGSAEPFKLIRYSFRLCGATRISVGHFYLLATSRPGPTIELPSENQALLDLTLDVYNERDKWSPAIDVVRSVIRGAPVPESFPRPELESPLRVYPAPPPPPRSSRVWPNNSSKPTPLRGAA